MSEPTTQPAKPQPVAKVHRYWPIQIAIWENENDDGQLTHSFTISRSYKDDEGYHDTATMYAMHCMELKMAIDDAWRWIKTVGRDRAFKHQQPDDATSDARGDVTLNVHDADIPF